MRIKISWSSGAVWAQLNDTPTSRKLVEVLPCESRASTWGDEVYFDVPVQAEPEEDARQVVDLGAVCYWVAGAALALLFGPTPVSVGDECRLVSEANVLGAIEGDPRVLKAVRGGESIRVELAEEG